MTYRIASLVPSITETLFALGLGDQVVARTGFCIHPKPAVLAVPKVGGTKDVNLAKLAKLKPTHVILNPDENTLETLAAIQAFTNPPVILSPHPKTIADNVALFKLLGDTFDAPIQAKNLAERFQTCLSAVQAKPFKPLRVVYLIWAKPYMTVAANTYIASALAAFNMHAVPDVQAQAVGASRYPVIDDLASTVRDQAANAVLLSTEPYPFSAQQAQVLQAELGVPVHLIDGEWTSWYGSRAIEALPALAAWRAQVK